MKKNTLSLYYFLTLAVCILTGCAATSQSLAPAMAKKTTKKEKLMRSLPHAIQVVQTSDRLRVIVFSDVCFGLNDKLTPNCTQQLSQTIKLIKSYGNGLIQVVGYSDDLYDPQTAAAITQDQAHLITSFLRLHGIEKQRLRTIGYGRHDFIASNRNIKASSFNRRVEIFLVKN